MRFIFVVISLCGSMALAEVANFGDLVKEASQQERRLHKKLLHALQGTQRSIAENEMAIEVAPQAESEEQIQESIAATDEMEVRLVADTDFKRSKRP